MAVTVKKDSKGPSYFVSHKRVGITEGIWLTIDELIELKKLIEEIV
jgi:hypothetical protein